MRDDLDGLEQVVVDEESVHEHEYGLGYAEAVLGFARGLGFEVLDAIVGDIANSASGECGYFWDFDIFVDGKLLLKDEGRIALGIFARPGLDDLEWIWVELSKQRRRN